jgi:hypothetical protein
MKKNKDLVIVIPIGPNSKFTYAADTIKSIQFYVSCSYKIIVIDNSQRNLGQSLKDFLPDIDILKTASDGGKMGGLYISLANAFKYALNNYEFPFLLRMDDDALIIGKDPEKQAAAIFNKYSEIGMLGRHIKGRFSPDIYGNKHDNVYPRNTLLAGTCTWKFIKRPLINMKLRSLMIKGLANGYELGENIQGGAYFISRECIKRMAHAGYLPVFRLRKSILCEDHIFSLLTKVVGLKLGDLSGFGESFGVAWQGLPASPEKLYEDEKTIIHSVRHWQEMNEDDIRSFFAACREKESQKPIRYTEAC